MATEQELLQRATASARKLLADSEKTRATIRELERIRQLGIQRSTARAGGETIPAGET